MSKDGVSGTASDLDLDVILEADGWTGVEGVVALCRRAARAAYAGTAGGPAEACLVLADDRRVRELNRQFRGRDAATDVLSFPSDALHPAPDEAAYLGDIIIAFETAAADAAAERKALADHLCHLVVHGILHLQGYDHATEDEALTMEALEVRALASLGVADPYGTPEETDD